MLCQATLSAIASSDLTSAGDVTPEDGTVLADLVDGQAVVVEDVQRLGGLVDGAIEIAEDLHSISPTHRRLQRSRGLLPGVAGRRERVSRGTPLPYCCRTTCVVVGRAPQPQRAADGREAGDGKRT